MKTHGFPGFGRTGFGRDEIYPELSVIPIKPDKTILSHVYSMFIPWMWVCHVYFTTYERRPTRYMASPAPIFEKASGSMTHGALEGPSWERRIQGGSSNKHPYKSGWWLSLPGPTPLKKIWSEFRQLGWWHSQLNGTIKFHGSKPPTRYYPCYIFGLEWLNLMAHDTFLVVASSPSWLWESPF